MEGSIAGAASELPNATAADKLVVATNLHALRCTDFQCIRIPFSNSFDATGPATRDLPRIMRRRSGVGRPLHSDRIDSLQRSVGP
eukprot:scaffold363_cov331-Pavlova_lutheri.AAC.38